MDEAGRNKLWENYTKTKSPDIGICTACEAGGRTSEHVSGI